MSEIIFSSSYDEKHPPENILNPSKDKYFASTGMFPQEICIQFETVKSVKSVSIVSYGIKEPAHTCIYKIINLDSIICTSTARKFFDVFFEIIV